MEKSLIYKGREVKVTTAPRQPGVYGFEAYVDCRNLNHPGYEGVSTEEEALDDAISFAKEHIDDLTPENTSEGG